MDKMTILESCYRLNIAFNPLMDNFSFPEVTSNRIKIYNYELDSLSQECIQWMESIGLELRSIHLFVQPAGNLSENIHIDGIGPSARKFGINWNFNVDNFEMRWYRILNQGTPHNSGKVRSLNFDPESVQLIETSRIIDPVLFRTDIPHSVMNIGDKTRYSLSLAFSNRFSWAEAVNHLTSFIEV